MFLPRTWVYFWIVPPLPSNGDHKHHHIYMSRTQLTSIFEGQPSKTRPFPIKTRVIWVLGIYIYIHIHIGDIFPFNDWLVLGKGFMSSWWWQGFASCGWGSRSISLPFPRLPKHLVRRYDWTQKNTHRSNTETSGGTVDGRTPAPLNMWAIHWIPGGCLEFLPSTVWLED